MDRTKRAKPDDKRGIEFRSHPLSKRADGSPGFTGYASASWVVDSYGTAFAPGAWTKTLQERSERVKILYQHETIWPIGLPNEMKEDETGLWVDAKVTESTQVAREAMALIREGILDGLSVGFRTMRERSATDGDSIIMGADLPEWMKVNFPSNIYIIEEAKLFEFSPVTFGANDRALIDASRAEMEGEALRLVLTDIRAGRLPASRSSLVAEIVAAWQVAPEGRSAPPRTDAKAPRRLAEQIALARWGHYLEQSA